MRSFASCMVVARLMTHVRIAGWLDSPQADCFLSRNAEPHSSRLIVHSFCGDFPFMAAVKVILVSFGMDRRFVRERKILGRARNFYNFDEGMIDGGGLRGV